MAWWCHITSWIWFKIDSNDGLLSCWHQAITWTNMLRYGRGLSTVHASLGATGPQMTLETQMSTNVVMPRPDDAFVASWRQLSDVIRGVCRKLAQVAKESSRNLAEKMASRNWLVLRHRSFGRPRALPHQLIGWSGPNGAPGPTGNL